MRGGRLSELLDSQPLEGTFGVHRRFGPDRHAAVIPDIATAEATIESFCEMWGGTCHLLVPFSAEPGGITNGWKQVVAAADVDVLWTHDLNLDETELRQHGTICVPQGRGEPLLPILVAQDRPREDWAPLTILDIDPDDPWYASYLGTFGRLPDSPRPLILQSYGFRDDLSYDEIVPVRHELVSTPGLEDLLDRLREPSVTYPTRLSAMRLGLSSAPRTGDLPSEPVLPSPTQTAREFGPNVVVIYRAEGIEDLCLLWCLRGANGQPPYSMPLALPLTDDLPQLLSRLVDQYAFTPWGLQETRLGLTSFSVDKDEIESLADSAGPLWQFVEPQAVLRTSSRPARWTTEIATFSDGQATIARWAASDREAIGWQRGMHDLHVNIALQRSPLPPSRTLEQRDWGARYRDGGFEVQAQEPARTMEIRWPTGWTVLQALACDRDLRVTQSAAGKSAAALLTRLGSIDAVQPLLDTGVLNELTRLSESRGISWFRDRVRGISEGARGESDQLAQISQHLASLVVGPEERGQRYATFDVFRQLLGTRELAGLWLEWAENAGLLIRGAEISCEQCGARSWRAVVELAPPIVCRGCGETVKRPFRPDSLIFRYRASEALIRAVEHDALSHLLAMRWFCRLFEGHMQEPGLLYGAYPGVEFRDPSDQLVGEADVVLVLRTGELIVGECKRSSVGLNRDEVQKLERLETAVDAPWSFFATTSASRDCAQFWRDVVRSLPSNPRFALTGEHLLEAHPLWTLGVNPFAWRDGQPDEHGERKGWLAGLPRFLSYLLGVRGPDDDLFERSDR